MKYIIIIIATLYLLPGCNSAGHNPSGQNEDTTQPLTVTDIRKARPEFPGYKPVSLIVGDTTRYLRIVLNNNKLIKTWMVYYDQPGKKWVTLTYIGRGDHNTVLLDTVFKNYIGIDHIYEDLPTFYVATTDDEGKSWQPFDMSLAKINGCKHPDLRLQKMAQLVVSNDFMYEEQGPSVAYIWQWSYTPPLLKADSFTANFDFHELCDIVRELKVRR